MQRVFREVKRNNIIVSPGQIWEYQVDSHFFYKVKVLAINDYDFECLILNSNWKKDIGLLTKFTFDSVFGKYTYIKQPCLKCKKYNSKEEV